MATKLSTSKVADNDVAADKMDSRQAFAAKPRRSKSSASPKLEPIEQKKKTATAAQHPRPASKTVTSKNTKADLILKKLRTPKGASIEMLSAKTGWQGHSGAGVSVGGRQEEAGAQAGEREWQGRCASIPDRRRRDFGVMPCRIGCRSSKRSPRLATSHVKNSPSVG